MNSNIFPPLPQYKYFWKTVFIEPVAGSGERIAIGAVIKDEDGRVLVTKVAPASVIRKFLLPGVGATFIDAFDICSASLYRAYSKFPISSSWDAPLEQFYLGRERYTAADNVEEAVAIISSLSSILFSSGSEDGQAVKTRVAKTSSNWRKRVAETVLMQNNLYKGCFNRTIRLGGKGIPLKFGFVSNDYAVQFERLSKSVSGLARAQGKLWQLAMLKESPTDLIKPRCYELMLHNPDSGSDGLDNAKDFVDELNWEAGKRQLSIRTVHSPEEAAQVILDNAAA